MLAVHEAGHPGGVPTLLIHGFMSSRHQWDPNLGGLGTRLRLVMVELPGHGDSPPPEDLVACEPAAIVAEFEAVRERLGVDRWWVIGQSFGGAFATRYALDRPDRVAGLVITNSRATFGVGADDDEERGRVPSDVRRMPFHPIHAKRFPPDLKERMVALADTIPAEALRHLALAAPTWRSGHRLGELAMPMLVVNGVWEKAFQPNADQVREQHPEIEVVDLEGGHSINVEAPEGFDHAVLDFIDRRG